MTSKPPYYRIYQLTVWQEPHRDPAETVTWRFRLEDPRSGRQQLFADVTTFMAALQASSFDSEETETPEGGGE